MSPSKPETLGDYFDLQRGTTYKSQLKGLAGPALLGLASIERNGGFRQDKLTTYGGNSPEKLLVRPGELFVSLKDVTQAGDLLGAVARVPTTVPVGRLTQDTVKLVPTRTNPPLAYLYWLLRTPEVRGLCRSRATGTTNLGLAREDFLSIPVPALTDERERIVGLLEMIEERLTLHAETNRTLEELTQALFKSWFIDFDGHDDLVDSEIGPVPRGWEVGCVCDVADVIDCLHSKKPSRTSSGRLLLQLSNIRDDGLLDFSDAYYITETDFQAWTSRILPEAGVCVVTNVGRVGAVGQFPPGVVAALGRNMTAVRCGPDFPFPTFLVEALRSKSMKAEIARRTDAGTVMDALNVRSIGRLRLVLPSHAELSRFETSCRPLWARREALLSESRTLTDLRDTLLPKLISGELRAPEAEVLVEAAG